MSNQILYTRSNGKTMPISEMAVPHLQNAIAKMKADGYISPADISLYESGGISKDEVLTTMELIESPLLGELEMELKGRMG